MARKWPVDGDHSERLPHGVKEVGYDEATQIRTYSVEGDDRLYEGVPGAVYSPITPINPPQLPSSTPRQRVSPAASDDLGFALLRPRPSQRQQSFSSRPSTGDSTLVPSVASHPDSFLNRSNTFHAGGPGARRKPTLRPLTTRRSSMAPRKPSLGSASSDETIASDDIEPSERKNARKPSLVRSFSKKVGGLKRAMTAKSSSRSNQPESSSPSHIAFSPAVNRTQTFASSSSRPSTCYGTPPRALVPIPTTFDDILANEYIRQSDGINEEDERKAKYKRILRRTTWSY